MLASIIPVFELFMQAWTSMKADPVLRTQNISHFIDAGLQVAQKYYQKLRKNHTYIIAMCTSFVVLFLVIISFTSHQSSTRASALNGSERIGLQLSRNLQRMSFFKRSVS
jgi:hypothetical protein